MARSNLRAVSGQSPSQRLQANFAAAKISFTWMGVRKTLTHSQKTQVAEPFGAEEKYLSAAKKLLDTSNPLFRQTTTIRNRIVCYWKGMTLPYPEPGLRLIRQDQIQRFDEDLHQLRQGLSAAVAQLDEHYEDLQQAARQRLGRLYADSDYPNSLVGLFDVNWEFPSVQPPEYLMRLNPQLYEQEKQRIAARFDEAVRLAESAFVEEFAKLVSHLTERISGGGPAEDKKIFRDGVIDNLQTFFERFKSLNVHSNAQLDELVATAQNVVKGIAPQDLRDSQSLRQQVSTQLTAVAATLDGMLVDAPRRRILRPAAAAPQVA
jgi:hypothetical protein